MSSAKVFLVLMMASCAVAQGPDYAGPAILSRGQLPGAQQSSGLFNIRPFVTVLGTYDDGLTGTAVDSQGKVLSTGAYGIEGQAGVTGSHSWKSGTLGLSYTLDGRHYTKGSYYDAINQTLNLNYARRLTRRWELNLQEAAGITNQGAGFLGGSELVDPALLTVPTNEIFNDRVYYQSTYSTVTYHKSKRLSFSVGGSEFLAQRHSPVLISGHGYGAYGDVGYQFNKASALTVSYNFGHFAFAKSFGASDFHTFNLGYARRIGRRWQLSIAGGATRIEVLGLALVPIDPVIAAIIGQSSGVQVAYHLNYIPSAQANLSWKSRRSSFTLNYTDGVTPGNGVYLTSRSRTGGGSYNYAGLRKWSLGAAMDYSRMADLSRAMGSYNSYGGDVNASYRVVRSLFITFRGDVRDYTAGPTFGRRSYHVAAGFTWSPGDYPISFK